MSNSERQTLVVLYSKPKRAQIQCHSLPTHLGHSKRTISLFIISPFRNPSQIKPSDHSRLRRCMPNDRRFILVIAFSFIRTYCHPNRLRIFVVQKMGPKGSSIFTRRLYLSKYSFSSNSLQVNWNWPRFIYIKNKNSNRWFSAL